MPRALTDGKRKRPPVWRFPLLVLAVGAALLNGCASERSSVSSVGTRAELPPVRNVDFSRTPKMKELAARAREVGNEMYPKILPLITGDASKTPRQFDIIFKPHLETNAPGHTLRTRIYLDASWLETNAATFDFILVHEMTHVAQHYNFFLEKKNAMSWVEGMADYTAFRLGYTNMHCPECYGAFPDYASGYACAGAFLMFVEERYDSNIVRQLGRELSRRSYSDQFFADATGTNLETLWAEFKQTPAYTPLAAELNELRDALGYVNGKPPRDVQARFAAYLKQNADPRVLELFNSFSADAKPEKKNIEARIYTYLYLKNAWQHPADTPMMMATGFINFLYASNRLPGLPKDGREMSLSFRIEWDVIQRFANDKPPAFPFTQTFHVSQKNDPFSYDYTVAQESKSADWKLQKASRTDKQGHVLEEYSVP